MRITGYYMDCMVIMPDKRVVDVVCIDCATKLEALAKIKALPELAGGKLAFFDRQKIDKTFNYSEGELTGELFKSELPNAEYYL